MTNPCLTPKVVARLASSNVSGSLCNSLLGTNPETDNFRTIDEIQDCITKEQPNVLAKAENTLAERLEFLCSKVNDPRVRRHPGDRYALSYSVRTSFHEDNLRLQAIKDKFVGSLNIRFNEIADEEADQQRLFVVTCVQLVLVETYRKQAINFAASFTSRDFETDIRVHDILDRIILDLNVPKKFRESVTDFSSLVFRQVCYSSREEERDYLNLLMKYFSIHFMMDGNSAVSRYFSDMAASLRLFVGTDIIVRCLSETLVQKSSRGMENSLELLRSRGVRLSVTRQTVQEVFAHIRHSTGVFRREYEHWFRCAKLDEVKNSDRILIRSFFYAYLEPERHVRRPKNWSDYLRNFGAAAWFAKTDATSSKADNDGFASFLIDKYDLKFVDIDEVLDTIDDNLAAKITDSILKERDAQSDGSKILARNDAEMALFVNSERISRKERVSRDLYGYNTWWMTEETAVLRALKQSEQPDDVIMHPQFLMNHFVLDPSYIKRNSSENRQIMPTTFGLRITDRVCPSVMKEFIQHIGDLSGLDGPAQNARIRIAANILKQGKTRSGVR